MRNKRNPWMLAFILVALLVLVPVAQAQDARKDEKAPEKTFTLIKEMPRLPALSQGNTGTCWCFSTTSFLESEMQRLGKKMVDLSEMYTVYQVYKEKADHYIRTQGNNTFAEGGFSHDVPWAMNHFGAVPAAAYTGLWSGEEGYNHSEMSRVLKSMLDAVLDVRRGSGPSMKWRAGFDALLEAYMGKPPEKFMYEGKEYTPRSFMDQVVGLNFDDYVEITSFEYLPWYGKGEHVIPDNWAHFKGFNNLPLDEYMKVFDGAVRNGYTVAISTDMSEKGFNQKIGYATYPDDKAVTQDEREKMWNDWDTTDDHGMHAVGVATDEKGGVFYLVKNSWGADPEKTGPYQGHIYMSTNFLRAKMHAYMLHKDAIPAEIREKLGIK